MTCSIIEKKEGALRFHAFRTDKFKMSRLSLNFILPADAERSPLTRLMLAVMMRGCRKYPAVIEINKKLDELYGATVTWRAVTVGERHIFKISCEMLSNKYTLPGDRDSVVRRVCSVVLDILLDPLLDEEGLLSSSNLESERKLLIDAIHAKINDQKAYAAERCRDLMLAGEQSGISVEGNVEMLESFTLRQVSENIQWFLKNAALECYYVGSDETDDVVELLSKRFAELGRELHPLCGEERALTRPEDFQIRKGEDSMQVSQSRLNVGYTVGAVMGDVDYHAMTVFNEIFGGSSVGKLFINVREKKSLCYYCYSSYASATGVMTVGCGIKKENKDKAFSEIEKQLHQMKKGKFTDEEIKSAKRTIISGLYQMEDSPSAIEAFFFRRFLAGVEESAEDCIRRISAVTREDIIRAAEKVKLDTVYFLSGDGEEDCDERG